MATYIEPMTDAVLRITVQQAGVLRDDATVVANIYNPKGTLVAEAVALSAVGGGSGAYTLSWLNTWTTLAGKALQGEYLAVVTSTRAGVQRVRRFRVPVRFDDDS